LRLAGLAVLVQADARVQTAADSARDNAYLTGEIDACESIYGAGSLSCSGYFDVASSQDCAIRGICGIPKGHVDSLQTLIDEFQTLQTFLCQIDWAYPRDAVVTSACNNFTNDVGTAFYNLHS
jgi:hypothetical protein